MERVSDSAGGTFDFARADDAVRTLARSFFEWFGEVGIFCGKVARSALTPPYELREFVRQLDEVGSKSVLLVAVAGAAIGVVLSLETRNSLIRFGAESSLPAIIIVSIIRETGPIITGLIVSGRVGAGIGAALVMGWLVNTLARPVSFRLFLDAGLKQVTFNDFLPPTFKTVVFGLIIGVVACFQGMHVKGGTEGVGRAATNSVVLASLLIILADVILVRFILVFFP